LTHLICLGNTIPIQSIFQKHIFFLGIFHNLDCCLNFSRSIFRQTLGVAVCVGIACEAKHYSGTLAVYWAIVTPKTVINVSVRVTTELSIGNCHSPSWLPVNNYSEK
jgi:hypothetical protein